LKKEGENMSLFLRTGNFGNYWGNDYNSSDPLNMTQMEVNAIYIYNALNQNGWTLNAIAGILRKYAIRKLYKSTVAGKVI
jgi:hypothetical protein